MLGHAGMNQINAMLRSICSPRCAIVRPKQRLEKQKQNDANHRVKNISSGFHDALTMPNDQKLRHAGGDSRQPETRSEN